MYTSSASLEPLKCGCRDDKFFLDAQPTESSAAQGYSVHGDNQGRTDLQAATLDLMADDQVLPAALPPWAAWMPDPLLQGGRAAAPHRPYFCAMV